MSPDFGPNGYHQTPEIAHQKLLIALPNAKNTLRAMAYIQDGDVMIDKPIRDSYAVHCNELYCSKGPLGEIVFDDYFLGFKQSMPRTVTYKDGVHWLAPHFGHNSFYVELLGHFDRDVFLAGLYAKDCSGADHETTRARPNHVFIPYYHRAIPGSLIKEDQVSLLALDTRNAEHLAHELEAIVITTTLKPREPLRTAFDTPVIDPDDTRPMPLEG